MDDYQRLLRATAHIDAPFALVDLDAFDANAADLVRRAAGKPIRVASKSVRCRRLLRDVLDRDGFAGVMSFTLREALWLHGRGFRDLLVAYPTADRGALRALAADQEAAANVTLMVDDPAQLDLVEPGAAPIRVCLDLDTSWRPLGGRVRVGARRSPLRDAGQAAAFARHVTARPGLRLVGVMAYEAQIAGVGDDPPGRPLMGRAIRAMQRLSGRELARRRAQVVRAVREVAPLEFVNGGGTGSVERTVREGAVTEVAAGSGLYAPSLFSAYTSFTPRPAALFALPVVRRPGAGVATALGGGYVASGAAGADRLPEPHLPEGLSLDPQEGAGEVQTPLLGAAADRLRPGDVVFLRHAKAGELCERFNELHLVRGDRVVETVPTYRGEGQAFL
ncbi:MAG TPA: amino acid deaminase/aldolase [Solirubrobacteraceae bacterium]|nr:amino acid deaminase/aldolase [Solirubrobacteraceae bacterium]